VDDARARRYLRAYSGVAVALVPPVVPDSRLGSDCLALSLNDRLPIQLHCHLALQHSEALDRYGVLVFSASRRANQRGQFHDAAAISICVGQFEDRCALAGNGILPNFAHLDRGDVSRTIRVGMRHTDDHKHCHGPVFGNVT